MDLSAHLEKQRARVNKHLEGLLPPATQPPAVLHQAMRYSVMAGGKRIRPVLCLEAAAVISDCTPGIEDLACALELIHTYSLIHDDLPALDNDDLRRGQPTCHKKFGEAIAILAGDGLLTLAFEVLARMPHPEPSRRTQIIREIGVAAGTRDGMVGGQVWDLEAEGKEISPQQLETIHRAKTGALLRASVVSGALFAGARGRSLEHLRVFGTKIGLAFQIVDDILDVRSSSEELGKAAQKDAARRKATYPGIHGLPESERRANLLVEEASAEMDGFGARARILKEIAHRLLARNK